MTRTVMVVEDDAGLQEVLAGILELEGYRVVGARDGLDALDRLSDGMPDLILLDLMMPRMDGYTFVAELQQRGLRSAVPILVLTADGRAPQKAAQLGVEGHLEKPFALPELLDEIERLINA